VRVEADIQGEIFANSGENGSAIGCWNAPLISIREGKLMFGPGILLPFLRRDEHDSDEETLVENLGAEGRAEVMVEMTQILVELQHSESGDTDCLLPLL